jgi:beta-lactamase class A
LTELQNLAAELRDIIRQSAAEVGLAAQDLAGGAELLIQGDVSFHPASMIKVCVMMEVFHQARQGLFSLEDSLLVKNEFASLAGGNAYSLASKDDSEQDLYARIGQRLGIRDLVERMITLSSNLATNLLTERVQPERATAYMRELGAPGLIVRRGVEDGAAFRLGLNNAATARGLMQILVKLARRQVSTRADSDEMTQILLRQQLHDMLPAGLPAGVRLAHKTGWAGSLYHDAGIVYPAAGEPFVLAILTNGSPTQSAAHGLIAGLGRAVYNAWRGQVS